MGIVNSLKGKVVFLDSAPLIYFIEGTSKYQPLLNEIFLSNNNEDFLFISSTLTLLEVLVQPLRFNRPDLVQKFEQTLLKSKTFELFNLDSQIALTAAKLRADYSLKTPDAIQIATALEYSADFFLTNDLKLKIIKELPIITLEETI